MSKITVIGSGYVGLVTGVCLAELGNHVYCLDLNKEKISNLNQGVMPIYEPGLEELVTRNQHAGRIQFSTDVEASVAHGDYQFIAVGTPPDEDGSADLSYVIAAARNIGKYMNDYKVIIDKSTVPVGTAHKVDLAIKQELKNRSLSIDFTVVSNPEFLKEGDAINDFMRPDRIVIGVEDSVAGLKAKEMMRHLYAPFNRNHERTFYMDVKSAELTKYAANAMLATRISFMNELANLADLVGADIEEVRIGMGSDSRIGYAFLYAGTGYGGSCFPKDVEALCQTGRQHGLDLDVLNAVERVNQCQKTVLNRKINDYFQGIIRGKTFAVWGLAFKPNTDDMREAPSREIIGHLLRAGARIQAFDPIANHEARRSLELDFSAEPHLLDALQIVDQAESALKDADALIIVTEWKQFKSPDFDLIKRKLKQAVVFDGRNLYEPATMKQLGFDYFCVGRNHLNG